jgi:hypothetical protein
MIRHRSKSPKWRMKRFGHLKAHERKVHRSIGNLTQTSSTSRLTASFEYAMHQCSPEVGSLIKNGLRLAIASLAGQDSKSKVTQSE